MVLKPNYFRFLLKFDWSGYCKFFFWKRYISTYFWQTILDSLKPFTALYFFFFLSPRILSWSLGNFLFFYFRSLFEDILSSSWRDYLRKMVLLQLVLERVISIFEVFKFYNFLFLLPFFLEYALSAEFFHYLVYITIICCLI